MPTLYAAEDKMPQVLGTHEHAFTQDTACGASDLTRCETGRCPSALG
jgi:hypothetical protein